MDYPAGLAAVSKRAEVVWDRVFDPVGPGNARRRIAKKLVATLLSLLRGFLVSRSHPRLTPWALFLRRFAAVLSCTAMDASAPARRLTVT